MRNIWTLRNNDFTEDWNKRNTRPNGIPGLTEYGDLGMIFEEE